LHLELVVVLCHLLVVTQFVLSFGLVQSLSSVDSVSWVHLLLANQVVFSLASGLGKWFGCSWVAELELAPV
jgi:hypothetical protein